MRDAGHANGTSLTHEHVQGARGRIALRVRVRT
jgi:hypothetical protein